jgi:hypothetical protein
MNENIAPDIHNAAPTIGVRNATGRTNDFIVLATQE